MRHNVDVQAHSVIRITHKNTNSSLREVRNVYSQNKRNRGRNNSSVNPREMSEGFPIILNTKSEASRKLSCQIVVLRKRNIVK